MLKTGAKKSAYPSLAALLGMSFIVLLAITLPVTTIANEYDDEDIDLPYVEIETSTDFSALGDRARASDMIIMLQMSASYCDYCELLDEEIIKPMLRSGDYTETVFIRKIEIDSYYNITDFDGELSSPDKLAKRYNILVTPTLLFLDGDGNEVTERILGVNSLDFYGGYVDDAIDESLKRLRQ